MVTETAALVWIAGPLYAFLSLSAVGWALTYGRVGFWDLRRALFLSRHIKPMLPHDGCDGEVEP